MTPPRDIGDIAAKFEAADVFAPAANSIWALRPRGTVLPYFGAVLAAGESGPVRYRLMLLEGWQTLFDFIRTRADANYGFCQTPMELAHYELVFIRGGVPAQLLRYDPGYAPASVEDPVRRRLCAKLLWESLGVMMRLETDPKLMLSFGDERSMFSRIEGADGAWADAPLRLVESHPHVERISFAKDKLAKAKDLPLVADEAIELDFRLQPGYVTRERRPRLAYLLAAIDSKSHERIFWERHSVMPDAGLRGLWEGMPPRVLEHFIGRGRIPGEIKLVSGRVFRMLRPLAVELPFKLSLHDRLENLQSSIAADVPPAPAP